MTDISAVQALASSALPSCTYNNGSSGVGATLTATSDGALTIDGYTVLLGDRVAVTQESGGGGAYNGIYSQTTLGDGSTQWVLTRTTDFDTPAAINAQLPFCVLYGTQNGNSIWCCNQMITTIGTDGISLAQMAQGFLQTAESSPKQIAYSAGNVGIGNSDPSYPLDVGEDARFSAFLLVANIAPVTDSTTAIRIFNAAESTTVVDIDTTNGRLGIGNTAPGAMLDIGNSGSTLGTVRLEGNTSGYVQLQPAAAAGSWTMTLPSSAGTNGYVLQTDGTGVTSWVAQSGGGTTANALASATTTVNVSSATAPVAGQVLTATSSTTATWQGTTSYNVSYLVAAGGGGGGSSNGNVTAGGGAGAGGLLTGTTIFFVGNTYTIIIGAGGAAGQNDGVASSLSGGLGVSVSAVGGGGGGNSAGYGGTKAGLSGGSGGAGGGGNGAAAGGAGTVGQGNAGAAWQGSGSNTSGGGGAGAVGGSGNSGTGVGGVGGVGLASSITGSSVYYCGGGGGGSFTGIATAGTGGSGGGGNGGYGSTAATAGTANTGGGGGGQNGSINALGAAGGSGIVILSVPTANYSGTTTGSPTVTTSGSNTIIKFTASGSYTA